MYQSFAPLRFENKTVLKRLCCSADCCSEMMSIVATQLNAVQMTGLEIRQHLKHFIEHFRFIGISTDLYHKQKYFTAGHSLSNIDNAA